MMGISFWTLRLVNGLSLFPSGDPILLKWMRAWGPLPLRGSQESYPVYRTGAWVDSSKDAVGTPGVSGWGAKEKNRAESDPTLGA